MTIFDASPYRARAPRRVQVLILLWTGIATTQSTMQPAHAPIALVSPVQDKNFYLLSQIERTSEVRGAVQRHAVLARIAASRVGALDKAAHECVQDVDCYVKAFRWSDEDSKEAGTALAGLYDSSPEVRSFVDGPLRLSGMYIRYNAEPGGRLLERAWADCAAGMNRMMDVYGTGKAPRYPEIDAMTYDAASTPWKHDVQILAAVLDDDRDSLALFFSPSLRFATELMWLNHRDEAGRHEPLDIRENEAALRHVASVDWSKFPYFGDCGSGGGERSAGSASF